VSQRIKLLLSLMGCILLTQCEKDDVCVEGDTALLHIAFYDKDATDEQPQPKAVNKLRVISVDEDSTVNTFNDRSTQDDILIPLDSRKSFGDFVLISNSVTEDNLETGQIEDLRITYTPEAVYISRACGFVGQYADLGIEQTGLTSWISSIEINNTKIDNSNEIHVSVFH
tara:strand:+ start:7624 stop:8133 length:510 start_codon:yes stop_codon:yes gene_type:complete